jgi:peptidoglycan/xylan/chitin deacetylase (PgdA/CDA1 family)
MPAERASATPVAPAADPAAVIARAARVPVLCYHQIRTWRPADTPQARVMITPPAQFAAQMDLLAAARYHTISPRQLLAALTAGGTLPPNPVLLTFDDGSETQYTAALPVLRRHGFTATFFLMTIALDKPHYLSRAQVRELVADGMTIGLHTWSHRAVTQYQEGDWPVQIDAPARDLAGLVGAPVQAFAFPFGLWDHAALRHLQGAGLLIAFQLGGAPDPDLPILTLPRILVSGDWTLAHFAAKLARIRVGPPARSP